MPDNPIDPTNPITTKPAPPSPRIDWRKIWLFTFLSFMANLALQSWDTWERIRYRDDLTEVVHRIQNQTSPQAQERQSQAIEAIIVEIDCNSRQAFQDALDALADQGIIEPGSIIVTENCTPD